MISYYYLVSSLPDIRADAELPITYDEFLELCSGNVSAKEYELLKTLDFSKSKEPVVRKWGQFYDELQKELNNQRRALLGMTNLEEYDRDENMAQFVFSALSAKNPLEAEEFILERQFENLDSFAANHYFDGAYLVAYAIKLQLLTRRKSFGKEKGREEFGRIMNIISERVYGI